MMNNTGSSQAGHVTSHSSVHNCSNVSVRYPGASTPIAGGSSPVDSERLKLMNSSKQARRDKMNLPVGPLAEAMEFLSSTKDSSVLLGKGKNFNVTMREGGKSNQNHHDGTLSFSPISINESRNPIKLTVPRKVHQGTSTSKSTRATGKGMESFLESSVMSVRGRSGKSSKVSSKPRAVFPYPDMLENMNPMEPGEMLYRSLKTLELWKRATKEQQRLPLAGAAGRGKRKEKEQPESSESYFEFTPDMFASVNTDAFVEVMYLVLSCYDQKETDSRFRDCWPVYEMKMISPFRRVCLDWMKLIISEHPEFFRDFKVGAISGLLVNPGGDRFISMMNQLCGLTMFKVASTLKGLVKEPVLHPPAPSSDPEITNRQTHLLSCKAHRLFDDAIETHCETLELEEMLEERLSSLDRISALFLEEDDDGSDLDEFIYQNPEIFADDLMELSEGSPERDAVYTLSSDGTVKFENPILNRLESILKARVDEIYTPVSLVENVIQDYEKIWHILDMDRSTFPVLDLYKIDSEWVKDEQGVPSLHQLIANITKSVHEIVNNGFLNRDTPSACLSEFNSLRLRIDFLDVLEEKVKQQGHRCQFTARAIDSAKALKHRFEGFDWSFLSGVQEEQFSSCFDMSPMRVYDMSRRTGRTPHMNDFLNASVSINRFDPSLRQHRRNGSLANQVPGSSLKSSFRKSTDCASTPRSSNVIATASPSHSPLPSFNLGRSHRHLSASENISSPLSSQLTRRNTSLLFDSSDVWDNSSKSTSMRKSVSFLDTIVDVSPTEEDSSSTTINNHATEPHSAPSTPSAAALTPDTQSLSPNSSLDDSLVEASVKERVRRLLESATLPDPLNESEKTAESEEHERNSEDASKDQDQSQEENVEDEDELSKLLSSFENISYTQDWAGMKGIMETSHIELALNSDSDD